MGSGERAGVGEVKVVGWRAGWKQGDFVAAVLKAGGFAPGVAVQLDYQHEPDCPRLGGGPCRCDPQVTATIHPAGGA